MIKLYGAVCTADISALSKELPEQWLAVWNTSHKIGKNEKNALLSLSALSLLHRAGAIGTLCYAENGRPYFEERTCDFSITHTQNHVFCALTDGEDETMRIGIDAEDLDRPDFSNLDEMAARWFGANEQKVFLASPTKETFLSIWTRKEAYVKYTGEGLRALSQIDTVVLENEGRIRFFDYREGDILISLCVPHDVDVPQNIVL
ncbi:MAG: 4'-phosphopantetheinyl transferase superfamily protein [Clostridia bacterium]|nr:4'-phosphopantetheinyl transferase superfamily protein [Clostridia bacterium]